MKKNHPLSEDRTNHKKAEEELEIILNEGLLHGDISKKNILNTRKERCDSLILS